MVHIKIKALPSRSFSGSQKFLFKTITGEQFVNFNCSPVSFLPILQHRKQPGPMSIWRIDSCQAIFFYTQYFRMIQVLSVSGCYLFMIKNLLIWYLTILLLNFISIIQIQRIFPFSIIRMSENSRYVT
jgi:hypothetical protein